MLRSAFIVAVVAIASTLGYLFAPFRAFLRLCQRPPRIICGACGEPWRDGLSCSQKENGWAFPTCYPCGEGQHVPPLNGRNG